MAGLISANIFFAIGPRVGPIGTAIAILLLTILFVPAMLKTYNTLRVRRKEQQTDVRCAYCKDPLVHAPRVMKCSQCGSLHHSNCFEGGCANCAFTAHANDDTKYIKSK